MPRHFFWRIKSGFKSAFKSLEKKCRVSNVGITFPVMVKKRGGTRPPQYYQSRKIQSILKPESNYCMNGMS